MKYLLFELTDNKKYAIKIESVFEVIENTEVKEIPNSPIFLHGLKLIRNHYVVVLNIESILNEKVKSGEDHKHILIVGVNEEICGVLVKKVIDIIEIEDTKIDALNAITRIENKHKIIQGVALINKVDVFIVSLDEPIKKLKKSNQLEVKFNA